MDMEKEKKSKKKSKKQTSTKNKSRSQSRSNSKTESGILSKVAIGTFAALGLSVAVATPFISQIITPPTITMGVPGNVPSPGITGGTPGMENPGNPVQPQGVPDTPDGAGGNSGTGSNPGVPPSVQESPIGVMNGFNRVQYTGTKTDGSDITGSNYQLVFRLNISDTDTFHWEDWNGKISNVQLNVDDNGPTPFGEKFSSLDLDHSSINKLETSPDGKSNFELIVPLKDRVPIINGILDINMKINFISFANPKTPQIQDNYIFSNSQSPIEIKMNGENDSETNANLLSAKVLYSTKWGKDTVKTDGTILSDKKTFDVYNRFSIVRNYKFDIDKTNTMNPFFFTDKEQRTFRTALNQDQDGFWTDFVGNNQFMQVNPEFEFDKNALNIELQNIYQIGKNGLPLDPNDSENIVHNPKTINWTIPINGTGAETNPKNEIDGYDDEKYSNLWISSGLNYSTTNGSSLEDIENYFSDFDFAKDLSNPDTQQWLKGMKLQDYDKLKDKVTISNPFWKPEWKPASKDVINNYVNSVDPTGSRTSDGYLLGSSTNWKVNVNVLQNSFGNVFVHEENDDWQTPQTEIDGIDLSGLDVNNPKYSYTYGNNMFSNGNDNLKANNRFKFESMGSNLNKIGFYISPKILESIGLNSADFFRDSESTKHISSTSLDGKTIPLSKDSTPEKSVLELINFGTTVDSSKKFEWPSK